MNGKTIFTSLSVVLAGVSLAWGGITIGPGPVIGTDTAGNTYHEQFQDWEYGDCRALDGAGSAVGGRYNWGDGLDDSRDLVAFYSRAEGENYYFRVDVYDLALGAENGSLDIYVAIDCATGGEVWMPDWTDVQVDPSHGWEVCVKLYDSVNYDVVNSSWNSVGGFLGAHYHSELDSVEFGITKQILFDNGWDGSRTVYFTVMTVRDGSADGGAGNVPDHSDATDTFFDDGRGYDDGVINGAIASDSSTGRAKYAAIAHGNQSINKADDLRVHIYDPPTANKTGFVRALDTHEIFNVPLNIHMSGSLISACQWAKAAPGDDPLTDGPSFLDRVAEFVNNDQNDGKPGALVGGVFAEHIMPYFEGPVNAASIEYFNDLMLARFGLTVDDVKVMHTPERVIRSKSTNLSPLDGHTFEDIEESDYVATYIDEVTHLHWWFYPSDPWSGYNSSYDAPHHHKIHKINDVYCFVINDREDQAKFGPHDGGMALDTRYCLVDKASQADQSQLTLVFDDWEAMAGKSFDPAAGVSVENNNQWQYQQTMRWAANHQWVEVVTLKDILGRAMADSSWVIDHGFNYSLTIQTYEWLKHAAENSYHYWYYNNDSGFSGNEQNFYNLVPVISGEQGDYHRRFPGSEPGDDAAANAMDGPKLPSGKKHGDMNSAGTLMHDAWAAIDAAPDGALKTIAKYAFVNLIYETAWHEEDYGATQHYQGTNFGTPWPVPDPTWDGVNTWALKLQNHVRSVGVAAEAASWAAGVEAGSVGPQTVVEAKDVDQDGMNEYVIRNNRVFACFECWGGRLTHAFAIDNVPGDDVEAIQVLGVPVSNPSEPGEEERLGTSATRCSTFKDMNASYVDAEYGVSLGMNFVRFTSADGKIAKQITLEDGSATLSASYTNKTGSDLYVRVGAAPDLLDLIVNGRDNLTTSQTSDYYEVKNSRGSVRTWFGTAALNGSPSDAGYENRNLALTEQVEVYGGSSFEFGVQIGTSMFDTDFDGDVDSDDLGDFIDCLTGPEIPAACAYKRVIDYNGDNHIDLNDFSGLQMFIVR